MLAKRSMAAFLCLLASLTASSGAPASSVQVPGASAKTEYRSAIVTGNGFGFAVLTPAGEVSKFYAHPYRFEHPDADPSKDGSNTANFVDRLTWSAARPPAEKPETPEIGFVNESHVLRLKKDGIEQFFFMPFALQHNVLIAMRHDDHDRSGDVKLHPIWHNKVKEEHGEELSGHRVRLLEFQGLKERLAIIALDGSDQALNRASDLGASALAFVVFDSHSELVKAIEALSRWQNRRSAQALMDEELKNLESWRVEPPVHFASEKEHRLWRQSESILRMAQIREENRPGRYNHGLILASLPDGVWFTPWVRDMAYSIVAMVRMGHLSEAREALLAYFNARPIGRWRQETRALPYQISVVRYYGDGSEEADYSGMQTPNVEFDDWGLALWACAEYWSRTHDKQWLAALTYRGTVYQSMRDYVVEPLLGNLDPYGDGLIVTTDSSLWEEHQQNKRHYASATMAAINGLRGFQSIAQAMQDTKTAQRVEKQAVLLEKGFKNAFEKDGALRGTVEPSFKNEIDGCLIEAFNWNIETDPQIMKHTIDKMELLKTASGGYRRVRGNSSYEKQEFLFVNFYLARLFYKLNRTADGERILAPMIDKACQDNCLIPELYVSEQDKDCKGNIGEPTGAIPMVGFGAGAYVITLIDREQHPSIAIK